MDLQDEYTYNCNGRLALKVQLCSGGTVTLKNKELGVGVHVPMDFTVVESRLTTQGSVHITRLEFT